MALIALSEQCRPGVLISDTPPNVEISERMRTSVNPAFLISRASSSCCVNTGMPLGIAFIGRFIPVLFMRVGDDYGIHIDDFGYRQRQVNFRPPQVAIVCSGQARVTVFSGIIITMALGWPEGREGP